MGRVPTASAWRKVGLTNHYPSIVDRQRRAAIPSQRAQILHGPRLGPQKRMKHEIPGESRPADDLPTVVEPPLKICHSRTRQSAAQVAKDLPNRERLVVTTR